MCNNYNIRGVKSSLSKLTSKTMTKLTYKQQIALDRKAAAAERRADRTQGITAGVDQVKKLYKNVEPAKQNRGGAKDFEKKDHVQWVKLAVLGFEAQVADQLNEGETCNSTIAFEEHLLSLRQLRPTLSRTDTQVRRQVEKVVHEVESNYECAGRQLVFDMDEHKRFMRDNWVGTWNTRFDTENWDGPVFALDAEWAPEFRAEVRQQLALKAPQIWVSLRK